MNNYDFTEITKLGAELDKTLSATNQLTDVYKSITEMNKMIDKTVLIPFSNISKELSAALQLPILKYADIFKELNQSFSDLKLYKTFNNQTVVSSGTAIIPLKQVTEAIVLKKMFLDITFNECADFINYITNYPMLSYLNDVGRKIFNIIAEYDKDESSDLSLFRVRKHEHNKKRAYTDNEMFEAPYKLPKQCRFSSNGQNYLYTSSLLDAAIAEVDVENDELYTWINLKLISKLNMLNICDDSIPLFKYCHIESEDKSKELNVEYLLPNYIADCAKNNGYNGIVYKSVVYPSALNYVFFNTGKRDFIVIKRGSNSNFT